MVTDEFDRLKDNLDENAFEYITGFTIKEMDIILNRVLKIFVEIMRDKYFEKDFGAGI